MNFKKLNVGDFGTDVTNLQENLKKHGFKVSTEEEKRKFFGPTTREAVGEFQKAHGIDPSCEVCAKTAALLATHPAQLAAHTISAVPSNKLPATGIVDEEAAIRLNRLLTEPDANDGVTLSPGEVPSAELPTATPSVVRGRLTRADGRPVPRITIRVFDKELRSEKLLAETVTNAAGAYAATYTQDQLSRPDKIRADLVVRAFGDDGREVAAFAAIIDAPAELTVDLVYDNEHYRGPSEYVRVRDALAPYLGQIGPAGLTADETDYLSAKTGLDAALITFLVAAEQLAEWLTLPSAVFYGLLRKGMPADRAALLRRGWRAVQRSLQAALDDNLIPPEAVDKVQVTAAFQKAAVAQAFDPPVEAGIYSRGDLLATTSLSRPQQESLLLRAVRHEGTRAEFRAGLEADPTFGADMAADVRFSLYLGQITGNHVPLVRYLQKQRRSGVIASARDLARLDAPAWRGVLNTQQNGQVIGAPPDTPGQTGKERIQTYAAALVGAFEKLYPTAALSGRLDRAADPAQAELVQFLARNPDFDLGITSIAAFLPDSDLTGVTHVAQLSADLKGMQRVYRLMPAEKRLDGMTALLDAGLKSARSITRYGKDRFIKTFAASVGGVPAATQVYNNANQTAAAALAAFTRYNNSQLTPAVIGSPQNSLPDIPDWETLFGSLDYCAYEHCGSVYSPAAYLADLVMFLDQYEAEQTNPLLPAGTALATLLWRRPDLGEIELTCVNTDTLMPYVALAFEVFENAIAGESLAYQTTWSVAELNANDEHINAVAYDGDHLAGQVYPFDMPFNLWVAEARTFLEHLGVSLYQLMDTFQREPVSEGVPVDALQEAIRRAGEYLKLTPLARRAITGDSGKSLAELWGMTGDLAAQLSDVPTFLAQTGLNYGQLLELLYTRFINPVRGTIIFNPDIDPPGPTPGLPGPGQPSLPEPPSPGITIQLGISISFSALCTLEGATLNRLDGALDRIHRFLRLQRALGWTIRDLDRVLTAAGNNAIDAVFLVRLMNIKQLLDKFGPPLDELLSWWANIEAAVYPQDEEQRPLYERLFLNNAVLNPVDDAFVLNEEQTELATIGLMSEHIPTIVAALEISAGEVDLIMAAQVADDTLNLANLSQLYRTVSLAGALDLNVAEFLSVSALIGIDPFDRSQISQTLTFVERVEQIRASAASIADLDYLLRHVYDPAAGIGLSQTAIRAALKTLRAGLTQIAQEHAPVADPTGATTAGKLALLLPAKALPEAMTLLAGTSKRGRDRQITFIETYFEPFLDPAEAVALLVAPPAASRVVTPLGPPVLVWLPEPQARYQYVLGGALSYLGQAAGQSLVTQQIAADFGLELAVAQALLTTHLPDSLVSLQALAGTADPAIYQAACQAYLLLHKITLALTKLGAGLADLPWLFSPKDASGQPYAFGWYDLSRLPLTAQDALDDDTYRSWARLVSVFVFRDSFPTGERSLFDVLAAGYSSASADPVRDAIVAYTGWARDDIRTLAGPDAFGFVFPDDYRDERYLLLLGRAFALLDLIGMPAEAVITWMPTDDTDAMQVTAQSIKQAVKAKYDDATWLTIAPPLKDALREKQRAALVTYLVATMPEIDRPSDLFEHFLIDGEMDACMDTSRIKQAISSVQLFVQRCLMGLEPGVQLPAEAAVQWQWMKQYRLWEANRKIFLYPENWIEPELRDDKTPFFEDLSSELLQSELTAESAETAYRHYLEQLDLVDRLEVRSLYHQLETADDGTPIDRLHVLARTLNAPYIHYYRQRIDDAYWTPWEPVNVSVDGNHEFLVVHQGTLYLFMPELESEEAEDQEVSDEYVEWDLVTLQWSTYQHGQWTVPQKAAQSLIYDERWPGRTKGVTFFKTETDSDDLLIVPLWNVSGGSVPLMYTFSAFRMRCGEKVDIDADSHDYTIEVPSGTLLSYMAVTESANSDQKLRLPWSNADIGEVVEYSPADEVEVDVLCKTPGLFELVLPHQYRYFAVQGALFYHGITRVFYVHPTWVVSTELEDPLFPALGLVASGAQGRVGAAGTSITRASTTASFRLDEPLFELQKKLKFDTYHHPYICDFVRRLDQGGVAALLQRSTQSQANDYFGDLFDPNTDVVSTAYPIDEVEFTYGGAYTVYNEELFFHAPLLIAERLRQNQRFEEAQRWYHYIFNPLAGANGGTIGPERYWIYYPFYLETAGETTLDMMLDLAAGDSTLANQVEQWRKDPFQPHALARLRPQAYQKTVVMKYIQNLIDWGDQLFTQDTIETLNWATQLYILAANILGPKPVLLPATETAPKTFNALKDDLDVFSNALVELENYIDEPAGTTTTTSTNGQVPTLTLYFGIPPNENLLALWDTVADRLFKIRHCMNIEGLVRQLPLFEPPIDPGLLVQAVAMGVDLSSVLSDLSSVLRDLYAPLPYYRFQFMLQKAMEFCGDVRSLGAALLSALEKKDSEELALLRAGHEKQLLELVRQIKEQQIEETQEALSGLAKVHELVEQRRDYYEEISEKGLNPEEVDQLGKLEKSANNMFWADYWALRAAEAFREPDVTVSLGYPPSIGATETWGGSFRGQANQVEAMKFEGIADELAFRANMASIRAAQRRRGQEWDHQILQAKKELEQIDKQIAAAQIRVAIGEQELENHNKQTEHAQEVHDFMTNKYTNDQLYSWMVSQISIIYFQSYQMAHDLAKRAEKAYQHELGVTTSSFISFGYWDSLKKGLLSGEKLQYDLRRMEMSYLENKREYEITKHISLTMLDPIALVMLKQSGECYFNLPEAIFDMDYPNHYMRRIKSISLTIPCITGPYTGVCCTLTLLSNRIRGETGVDGGYPYTGLEDGRFQHNIGANQSIATSGAQNDSGLFELNFRDERYLPFEGSGVISSWRLELPKTFPQFDYDTISDVIIHVRYTARDGGATFRGTVEADLTNALNIMVLAEAERGGLDRLFSLRHEFPNEWHRLQYPPGGSDVPSVTLPLAAERFPYAFQGRTLTIDTIELFVQVSPEFAGTVTKDTLKLSLASGSSAPGPALSYGEPLNGLLRLMKSPAGAPGDWTLALWLVPEGSSGPQPVEADALEDIMLVCHYTVS